MRLLVVEDDREMAGYLKQGLEEAGYAVDVATDGASGLHEALSGVYEAVLLDVMLPVKGGVAVVSEMRAKGVRTPVLMLTARDAVASRVQGLDAGADDYLVKPFAYEELAARLRALSRRPSPRQTPQLGAGPIELDEAAHRVSVDGRDVVLGPREFAVLECLLRRPGQVLSRDQLLDHAWPYGAALTPNTVEAYIHILREKLGPDGAAWVETVRGVGYRIRPA